MKHVGVNTMCLLNDGTLPVRFEICSTDEKNGEEERDGPDNCHSDCSPCNDVKHRCYFFAKNTAIEENETEFHEA